jgi:poly-beta-1,6-N-acetyl-D-glucosamine synthase
MEFLTGLYFVLSFFGMYFLLMFIILYKRNKHLMNDYPEPKLFPSVSFIVPAYNEEDSIANTLTALLNVKYPEGKKEILVVNDGSKDKTTEIVKKFMKNNKEIKLLDKPNSGKADSINQALKLIKGELVAITDADSYPEKNALIKMVGYFEENKEVATVTSRVIVKNKNNFMEKQQEFDYVVVAWSRKVLDFVDSVYVTNGPLSIYRAEIIRKIGGFDTKNLTEDIEITWHLLSLGYKTKMSYSTEVYTTVPSTLKKWISQRVRWNIGGLQTIFKYRKFILRGGNFFGLFILPYVSLAFTCSLIGIILLIRYIWIKASFYLLSLPYLFSGYNFFNFFKVNFMFTLLFILGTVFLIFSFVYYKFCLENSDIKNKKFWKTVTYIFIYRPLYLIPLIIMVYKMITRDIRWYTK